MGDGSVLTIAGMTAAIRANNIAKGWRSADGSVTNTFGDYVSLLHSELSEALEAYRDHRLDDATEIVYGNYVPKPQGVGAEFADVLIRVLDTCDIYGVDLGGGTLLADVRGQTLPAEHRTFGDHIAWLHRLTATLDQDHLAYRAGVLLRALVGVCNFYGIDLEFEFERKHAHNMTRAYQHGGRTLSETISR